jgi:hypothetical protein
MSSPTDVEALCFDMYCTTHDTHSVTAALREATDRPDEVIDGVFPPLAGDEDRSLAEDRADGRNE